MRILSKCCVLVILHTRPCTVLCSFIALGYYKASACDFIGPQDCAFQITIYEQLSLKELVEIFSSGELLGLPFLHLKWQIDFCAEEGTQFH